MKPQTKEKIIKTIKSNIFEFLKFLFSLIELWIPALALIISIAALAWSFTRFDMTGAIIAIPCVIVFWYLVKWGRKKLKAKFNMK